SGPLSGQSGLGPPAKPTRSVENDPKRTNTGLTSRSAAVSGVRAAAQERFSTAPSRTGRLGSIHTDEPAHRTPELARKACPVVERQRTAVQTWIARDQIVLVDAARDRIIFQFADRELLRRANEFLGAHALAQGIAAHERAQVRPRCEGDHSGVDIIAKRAVEYVPPDENSDTRLPAITTRKRTVRSPRLGADAVWTRIRDWDGRVCPMTIGRFKAHFCSRI